MIGRVVALAAALVVAVVAAGILLLDGEDEYQLTMRFVNASQLVTGNQVTVGGLPVGTVDAIELGDDNVAEVEVTITDEDLTPLHEGTSGVIRIPSLSSVAARRIELHPGPNSNPEIPEGGTIKADDTQSVVEIDSLLSALDAQTREATQDLLHNQRAIFEGRSAAANAGLVALNPALSQLGLLVRDIGRDSTALREFLVESSSVVGAIASRNADLDRALVGAAATAREISDERAALTGVLEKAPETLEDATETLGELDDTFTTLVPTARELRPVAPKAATLVDELQPLLRRSGPAIDTVQGLLPDLGGLLGQLPGLRDTAVPAFAAATRAIVDTEPIVTGTRPYVPDIFHGIVSGFGGTQAHSYDANGHYVRIGPVASSLSLTGILGPLGEGLQKLLGLPFEGDNDLRCPGGGFRQVENSLNNTPAAGVPCRPEDAP